jgi:hypothetical protein
MNRTVLLLLLAGVAAASACGGDRVAPAQPQTDLVTKVPAEDWTRLASMRIAFGHQSVGMDMLTGVADLAKEVPALKLNVVLSPTPVASPAFVHFAAGKNEEPLTKVDHFVKFIDEAGAAPPDIAMLKFCYIDANPQTDMKAVFDRYRTAIADLEARHPKTTFVHLTMPLRVIQTGWKVTVKNLLGRAIGGYADNAKRQQYNEMLRAEYGGKRPLFDLAAIESTRGDGSRVTFTHDGRMAFALAPEYTYDGGHLNEAGRRYVAAKFLTLLAETAKARRAD